MTHELIKSIIDNQTFKRISELKFIIKNILTSNIFEADSEKLEKKFNALAIKNCELWETTEEIKNFIYNGEVYPKTYMSVESINLHKSLYDEANSLIEYRNTIERTKVHMDLTVKPILQYSNNIYDIDLLMPDNLKKLLEKEIGITIKNLEKIVQNENVSFLKPTLSDETIKIVKDRIKPYKKQITRYTTAKALLFN